MKSERILIIDDHALIVEGYKNVLLLDNERYEIDTAFSCEEGFSKLEIARSHGFYYDIICLDMNLPAYDEMSILSGEDLGLLARKWFPKTKLVVLTMYNDNYRLYNIMKSLEPEAFLLKRDISPQEFSTAIRKCTQGEIYYSHTVNAMLRSTITSDFVLDKIDRSILHYLSKGILTKELPEYIPMSLGGIEKRKRVMKEIFDIKGGDLVLVDFAKKHGFL
ncbi:MAG: DNA-binding response regulator [Zunongwangia sp.]|uniref:Nitrate/nitrite DNA-binding response regulator n=2 Tax=Zunongwangia profunda TaxID=398743 RepID=D5BHV1_ZUNPS|nr:response regulator [Zunongwangia profunda]ADF51339.1 putative nitrate/nitrite DNA-binding response regulator [Zunongwangia profunda SM-A87]MAO35145.1 DNA-binding response regulator [Zunongwangia sp.]MAS69660.1 DNA-binding response regulator [Zunongwangia sp.]HCV80717.1 DNA-binding response regulator [Zunongwangia profunda]|tara:strand:- start:5355 stop:6014 length:660 start_codon:yes stop_codon:yes gene_type:complete